MLGMVADNSLYVRVDDRNRRRPRRGRDGALAQLLPRTVRPSTGILACAGAAVDEPDELAAWAQAGLAAAHRVAAKRGRPIAPARKSRAKPAKRRQRHDAVERPGMARTREPGRIALRNISGVDGFVYWVTQCSGWPMANDLHEHLIELAYEAASSLNCGRTSCIG